MIDPIEKNEYNGRLLSVFDDNLSLPRHRWYEFKEGFSSNLVLEAIHETKPKSHKLNILDPFAGSGTTLVAAGQTNHCAFGVEVNPFLAFASKAKTVGNKWNALTFNNSVKNIFEGSRQELVSPIENISTFSEKKGLSKWLFNTSVLRGYAALDQAIGNIDNYQSEFRLALFASLMDCCNAKRDGKCLRYRNNWETLGFTSNSLREVFLSRLKNIAYDIENYPFYPDNISIIQEDARQALINFENNSIDLVVTSPPYLNSFDYSDVYRPELFVGGFVQNNDELRQIRLKTIRSHVQASWEPSDEISSNLLAPIVKALSQKELWNRHITEMVTSYFVDMSSILQSLYKIVKKNGAAWIVVSTSAYGGVEIPVDLILGDIATHMGWNLKGVYVLRNLRSAGQQWGNLNSPKKMPLRESLIILKK